ncbi:hypothetical protein BD410DRAFT_599691 [Rickenella mellea]|uniref:DUF6534 domain-containing protein n=1 Tax=Rickenella mellea TaxID=50990 RepID=A0A4Y7QEA1_9AGAM|nr:hypothetical protein BD410DRAFT_599691 [Rickenella mellea]
MAAPSVFPALNDTFGALFIGLLIAMGLYGLLCLQCYMCYLQYPEDRYVNAMSGSLWILNTVHIVLICHAEYGYLINNFGNFIGLINGTWDIIMHIAVNCLIALFVQLFFAERVFRLTERNWYLTSVVVAFGVASFGFGIATTVKAFQLRAFTRLIEIKTTITASLATTVVCDVVITGILCLYLNKSRTGFKRTDSLINNLIWFSVSTGLIPSIFAIAQLVTYLAIPDNMINICISLFLGKLYSTSLLATINGRASTRAKFGLSDGNVQLSNLSSGNGTRINAGRESVLNFVGHNGDMKVELQPSSGFDKFETYRQQV